MLLMANLYGGQVFGAYLKPTLRATLEPYNNNNPNLNLKSQKASDQCAGMLCLETLIIRIIPCAGLSIDRVYERVG